MITCAGIALVVVLTMFLSTIPKLYDPWTACAKREYVRAMSKPDTSRSYVIYGDTYNIEVKAMTSVPTIPPRQINSSLDMPKVKE